MASPPSQQIALWVVDSLDETDWVLLSSVCLRALTGQLHGWHENDLIDLVEEHLAHIAEHLRDRAARSRVDGEVLALRVRRAGVLQQARNRGSSPLRQVCCGRAQKGS